MRLHLLCLSAAAALLAACSTFDDGRALFVVTRYHTASIDTYPVLVSKIDGKSTPIGGPAYAEPGARTVVVQTAPDRVHRFGIERSVQLQVEPCTRYWLVAVKPTALANDYEVKVDHQEHLAGCTVAKAG